MHQVDNVGIFVLLKFENKLDATVSHTNIILKYHDECKFALIFIQFLTNCNTLATLPTLCVTEKLESIRLTPETPNISLEVFNHCDRTCYLETIHCIPSCMLHDLD